jgi:REP element-mobilizing transposase RayT
LMPDHVHMLMTIPPKYAVSQEKEDERLDQLGLWR